MIVSQTLPSLTKHYYYMEVNEWQLDPAKANELRKQIPHENILLMRKIIKINRKNKGQERTIVMTNTSLFNL